MSLWELFRNTKFTCVRERERINAISGELLDVATRARARERASEIEIT